MLFVKQSNEMKVFFFFLQLLFENFPFFPLKKKRGNDPARLQMTELVFKPAQQGATPDSCAHSHKSWCVCSLGARRCTNLFPEANVNMH